jgi:hypothetical protein
MNYQIMKQVGIIIFILSIFFASCQKDDFTQNVNTTNLTGSYQFEETRIYPNIGNEVSIKNKVVLTLTPNYESENQVWIEEYGIYAIVESDKLNIPFQTDIAGQFSYVGYGSKDGNKISLFLNIRNHTANITQSCELKSTNKISILN